MAVRASRFYNDPSLGQAFDNIAQMFAPPESGDMANYALAKERNQKTGIIAQLAADPKYAGFDQQAILADLFDPTQSFYSVDQANATSRSNNAADNQRAIATNAADNTRLLAQPRFNPLQPGEMLPAVDPALSSMFDLPALSTVAGPAKPLSETEVKGLERQQLLSSGKLTQDDLVATILGDVPVENTVGPDGKPVITRRNDAVGMQPYFNKGAEAKPSNAMALMPDGKTQVTAIQGDDGKWYNAQTGEVLPDGIRLFDMPKAQGTAADVGLGPTTANQTMANNRRAELTRSLGLLDLYEGVIQQDPGAIGLAGSIKGLAQNAIAVTQDLASSFGTTVPDLQKFSTDLRDGLGAVAPEMFNPNIAAAEFYTGALAYALARTENPSGEVSRQAYDRAYDRVSGGALRNSQSAKAAVDAFRKMAETELSAIATLDDPSMARTDTSYQGGADVQTDAPPDVDPDLWAEMTPEEKALWR